MLRYEHPGSRCNTTALTSHFDEILITGCTGSCHLDNFLCRQLWKFYKNYIISVSVYAIFPVLEIRDDIWNWYPDVPGKTFGNGSCISFCAVCAKHYIDVKWACWLFFRTSPDSRLAQSFSRNSCLFMSLVLIQNIPPIFKNCPIFSPFLWSLFRYSNIFYAWCRMYFVVWVRISLGWWWRHQMETFSALLAICVGNSPVPGEFPAQRPVTRSFDVFFDLGLNKRLSKQSWGWWFETPSRSLWRHRNVCLGEVLFPLASDYIWFDVVPICFDFNCTF